MSKLQTPVRNRRKLGFVSRFRLSVARGPCRLDDWRSDGGYAPTATDATDTADESDPCEEDADPPDHTPYNHDPDDTPAHDALSVSDDEDDA